MVKFNVSGTVLLFTAFAAFSGFFVDGFHALNDTGDNFRGDILVCREFYMRIDINIVRIEQELSDLGYSEHLRISHPKRPETMGVSYLAFM